MVSWWIGAVVDYSRDMKASPHRVTKEMPIIVEHQLKPPVPNQVIC